MIYHENETEREGSHDAREAIVLSGIEGADGLEEREDDLHFGVGDEDEGDRQHCTHDNLRLGRRRGGIHQHRRYQRQGGWDPQCRVDWCPCTQEQWTTGWWNRSLCPLYWRCWGGMVWRRSGASGKGGTSNEGTITERITEQCPKRIYPLLHCRPESSRCLLQRWRRAWWHGRWRTTKERDDSNLRTHSTYRPKKWRRGTRHTAPMPAAASKDPIMPKSLILGTLSWFTSGGRKK